MFIPDLVVVFEGLTFPFLFQCFLFGPESPHAFSSLVFSLILKEKCNFAPCHTYFINTMSHASPTYSKHGERNSEQATSAGQWGRRVAEWLIKRNKRAGPQDKDGTKARDVYGKQTSQRVVLSQTPVWGSFPLSFIH